VRERSGHIDRQALRTVLREHGYLVSALQQRHRDEPQYQLDILTGLPQAVYGLRLGRSAVTEIVGNTAFVPTPALLAAVVTLTDPAEAGLAAWEHSRSLLFNTNFDARTGKNLRNLLRSYDQQTSLRQDV
jgi:hypothetical protein